MTGEGGAARAGIARTGIVRQLFVASRPLSWVNTAFPFAAAYLLAARPLDARDWVALAVGAVFFLVPYNLAMYGINDVFDYESDLRNPRKGGVEGAVLDRRLHRATLVASAVLALPFVVALVMLGSWASWIILAISLFAVLAYSAPVLRFKERPFLDSITSSTHFVSPAVYGLALASATVTPGLVLVLVAFFLWGLASHAFGAVQDVVPDREGGLDSIATVIGARATVRLAAALYALAGILLIMLGWPFGLTAVLAIPYLAMVLPFWRTADATSGEANRGWRRFLAINYGVGFLVTLTLIAYGVAS